MSQRKQIWLARLVLVLLFAGMCRGLSLVSIHGYGMWPYGRIHNLLEAIGGWVSYPVGIVGGGVAAVVAMCEIAFGFKTLWLVAWRRPHTAWVDRWKVPQIPHPNSSDDTLMIPNPARRKVTYE